MPAKTTTGVESILAEISAQLRALAERVERLEGQREPAAAIETAASAPAPARAAEDRHPPAEEPIPEEDLMAISAALAAYFGVRVRARRIRLISSPAWAQQGRVSVQASHRLMH